MNYLEWQYSPSNYWSAKTELYIYEIVYNSYHGYNIYITDVSDVNKYKYIGSYDTLQEAQKICSELKNKD